MSITIREPAAFAQITNVKCAMAGDGSGSICACGSALDQRGPLTGVWAKVVALGTAISDPHDPGAQAGSYDQKTGNWWFLGGQLLSGVPCVANPTDNTGLFVVWCAYAGSPTIEEHASTQIAAKCSTATNCDGSANPCQGIDQSRRILAAGVGAGRQATLETAPRQYKVQGGQARGPLAALVNPSWLLNLRSGGCGCSVVWINEGDGVRLPHVKLRPDKLMASNWHLTLTFNRRRIRYSCSAHDWSPLGVNRLVLAEPSDGDGLPETLTVSPV